MSYAMRLEGEVGFPKNGIGRIYARLMQQILVV